MLERPKRRLSVSGTGPGELERDHGHHAVIESARQTFELSGWAPHQHQAPSENRPHHQRETLLHPSLTLDAECIVEDIRTHWSVENNLH